MRSDAWKKVAISAQVLFALLALLVAWPASANDLNMGKPAPPATLVTLDGKHISTHDLLGHTIVLTFWATWCEPCREELPLLSRYAAAHTSQGLTVLAFSLDGDDNLAKVRAVASQLHFPAGLLSQSRAPGYGRMWRIPVSFVIDDKGILRYNGWNASDPAWTIASLNKIVGPLLTASTLSGVVPKH